MIKIRKKLLGVFLLLCVLALAGCSININTGDKESEKKNEYADKFAGKWIWFKTMNEQDNNPDTFSTDFVIFNFDNVGGNKYMRKGIYYKPKGTSETKPTGANPVGKIEYTWKTENYKPVTLTLNGNTISLTNNFYVVPIVAFTYIEKDGTLLYEKEGEIQGILQRFDEKDLDKYKAEKEERVLIRRSKKQPDYTCSFIDSTPKT